MNISIRKTSTFTSMAAVPLIVASVLSISMPAGDAQAYCNVGNGTARTFSATIKTWWGREESQYASTCDYDGIYKGRVKDLYKDGRYVQVRLASRYDMSNEWIHTYTGSSRNYTMWGVWYMRICKSGTPLRASTNDYRCSKPVAAFT